MDRAHVQTKQLVDRTKCSEMTWQKKWGNEVNRRTSYFAYMYEDIKP
jgi:hypothetical protein